MLGIPFLREARYSKDPAASYLTTKPLHPTQVLFSAEDGVAAFVEGKWQTPKSGMKYVSTKFVSGTEQGLGTFKGTEITWTAGAATTIVTTAKTYASGRDVGFEYSFPKGAKGTSQVISIVVGSCLFLSCAK